MRARPGAVLLEAVVALAIVATASAAFLSLASESMTAVQRAGHSDEHLRDASDFLSTVTLWPRADLDRRLGSHRQGTWTLRIQRESPRLYSIALLDSTGRAVLLETAVFRRDESR